jgi:hypothetical protein
MVTHVAAQAEPVPAAQSASAAAPLGKKDQQRRQIRRFTHFDTISPLDPPDATILAHKPIIRRSHINPNLLQENMMRPGILKCPIPIGAFLLMRPRGATDVGAALGGFGSIL